MARALGRSEHLASSPSCRRTRSARPQDSLPQTRTCQHRPDAPETALPPPATSGAARPQGGAPHAQHQDPTPTPLPRAAAEGQSGGLKLHGQVTLGPASCHMTEALVPDLGSLEVTLRQ